MTKKLTNINVSVYLGVVLSLFVISTFALMALSERCIQENGKTLECASNFHWFLQLRPNEVGDTLAGLAGTLAFIWIVVTVWLQSDELSQQREVLKEQKEEFKAMVAAQNAMVAAQNAQVEALTSQARLFEDEKRYRSEAQHDLGCEQQLILIKSFVTNICSENTYIASLLLFEVENVPEKVGTKQRPSSASSSGRSEASLVNSSADIDIFFSRLWNSLKLATKQRNAQVASELDEGKLHLISQLLDELNELEEIIKNASLSQKIRVERLRIPAIRRDLITFLKDCYLSRQQS